MPSSISRRELVRKFRSLGYLGPFSGRRHQFMIKERRRFVSLTLMELGTSMLAWSKKYSDKQV